MKRLLVCTDGSNYSQQCCRYGAWLAQQNGASIDVLYVTDIRQFEVPAVADLSGSLGIQPFEGMVAQLKEVEGIKAKFVEEQAHKVFSEAGVIDVVTFHHETGLLVDVLSSYAEGADLILLGKRGENANFATEHLGSMLERVLRSADQPCLVTARAFRPITKVAIAYDGGASCKRALEFVVEDALFKSVELHVVSVAEGSSCEDDAAAWLVEAEMVIQAAGLQSTCQVLGGEVESAIASYVEGQGVDLLIAGAYGHSRIREFLIGSTTTQLLRACHVSVLCFR